jgi:periplasmic divalent cation tolerance protein
VSLFPGIESVYWWEGKVQTDAEELLIIKTRESLLDALTEHVKANHEYDVPEVIALPIKGGNLKYLEWLKNSTRES